MQDNEVNYWERQEQIYKNSYVTLSLLFINIIVFILSNTFMKWLYEDGTMVTEVVLKNSEYYRLFSATFLHADIEHLTNNMLMLVLIGGIVENYAGHAYFLFMYVLAGLFGNMMSMAYEINNNLQWVSLGASGAIMGTVGFVVVWILINRRTFIRSRNMIIRLLFLALFVIQACFFQEGANTAAHLGGFLTGVVFGIINIVLLKNDKSMEGLA